MLKQAIIYFILSLLVILFAKYANLLIINLDILYTNINLKLAPLFSTNNAGILLRGTIVLTLLPVCVTGVPALVYMAFKKHMMPYYFELTWFVWLLIVVSKVIII